MTREGENETRKQERKAAKAGVPEKVTSECRLGRSEGEPQGCGEKSSSKALGPEHSCGEQSEEQPGWGLRSQDLEEGVTEGTGGQIVQGLSCEHGREFWLLVCDGKPKEGLGPGDGMIGLGLNRVTRQLC